MSILKRFSATLTSRVDQLVGEIENHDAVVEAGIRDARRAYATAKVRQARLCRDGARLQTRVDALRAQSATWRERAAGCADEERALECLRRAKRAGAEADALADSLREQTSTERRLAADIDALRRRVEGLEQRRGLLRSRAASADATARLAELDTHRGDDLEEIFERWEVRIGEREILSGTCTEDRLADDFEAEEERAELRAELAALKRGEVGHED